MKLNDVDIAIAELDPNKNYVAHCHFNRILSIDRIAGFLKFLSEKFGEVGLNHCVFVPENVPYFGVSKITEEEVGEN